MRYGGTTWNIVAPARAAVFGESTGPLVTALVAIQAGGSGLPLRAQVPVNPAVGLTPTMFDPASFTRHAHSPALTMTQMRLFHRFAVPLSVFSCQDVAGIGRNVPPSPRWGCAGCRGSGGSRPVPGLSG